MACAPPDRGARVRYLGHAALTVELAGRLLLTDPLLRRRVAFLRWDAPRPAAGTRDDVDAVLVSHLHQDHCDLRSLSLLGRDRLLLVPAGTGPFFRRHGFTQVVPLGPGETHRVGLVQVTATAAAHDGRRPPFGPRGTAVGFVLSAAGRRFYFAGDTDLFDGMRDLGGALDLALLPVAGWGRTLGPGHLDPVRAAEAVGLLRPEVAVPIHWGALRPLWHRVPSPARAAAPAGAFAAEVLRRRLPTQVRVLEPGGAITWPAVTDAPDR